MYPRIALKKFCLKQQHKICLIFLVCFSIRHKITELVGRKERWNVVISDFWKMQKQYTDNCSDYSYDLLLSDIVFLAPWPQDNYFSNSLSLSLSWPTSLKLSIPPVVLFPSYLYRSSISDPIFQPVTSPGDLV